MAVRLLLVQSLVPAGLLLIGVDALSRGFAGGATRAILVVAVAWLGAIAALFLTRQHARTARAIPKVNLLVVSGLLGFVVLESAVSVLVPTCRFGISRLPRLPNHQMAIDNSVARPGQRVTTTFSTNEFGLRGASLAASRGAFRIVAVGGSTTESYWQDDADAWPHRLEAGLAQARGSAVWVQNAGMAGHTTAEHLLTLESSPVAPLADLVIVLPGVNDLTAMLALDGAPTASTVQTRAEEAFGLRPLYSRSAVYKFLRLFGSDEAMRYDGKDFFDASRQRRRQGAVVSLPSLDTGLREYADRLTAVAEQCRAGGRRCLFLTQPTLWDEALDPNDTALLWLGWVGPQLAERGYVAVADLRVAMDRVNETTLRVARDQHVEAFDLAARIPKSSRYFFDDCHYTDAGAALVAESVAAYLRAHP